MSDYTPTNVEVRVAYVAYRSSADTLQQARTLHTPIFGPEFDRWLAEHDRQVAEKAWDEGRDAEAATWNTELAGTAVNPYREVTE